MHPRLLEESDKLRLAWMRHDSSALRDYLVADVEDPRLNLQSIFSRHFLSYHLSDPPFQDLMNQEYRFAAAMNALLRLAPKLGHPDDLAAVRHALERGSDNAEGLQLPWHLVETFQRLPAMADAVQVPNYVLEFLQQDSAAPRPSAVLDTFARLWTEVLAARPPRPAAPFVLEPACGSANDYRFLVPYGFAERIRYWGFDLCDKNIENARTLFPGARFEVGNVFEIAAPDRACDLCFVHDLFEHLSEDGLRAAVREICRVTQTAICAHFFSMDEARAHRIRPVDDYHWNTLSMRSIRDEFAGHGFEAQVFHIGTFLQRQVGCDDTHNPNAYTFWLRRTV